jgi:hypothetical protein
MSHGEGVEGRRSRWGEEHRRLREDWRKTALSAKDECPINPLWLSYCIVEVVD